MLECRFNFHWNLVLRVQLTINQHWFRYWLVAFLAPSHYQKQCWPSSLMHICSTRGRWVKSLANREGPGFALRILKRVLLPVTAHQTTLEWQWPREWDPCPCALRPIVKWPGVSSEGFHPKQLTSHTAMDSSRRKLLSNSKFTQLKLKQGTLPWGSINSSDARDRIFQLWGSIPCLLMHWLLNWPVHQQVWYWLCGTNNMYCCSRVDFIYFSLTKSKIWFKIWI